MIKNRIAAAMVIGGALAIGAPMAWQAATPTPVTAEAPTPVLPSFAPLVKATSPAVVTIQTEIRRGRGGRSAGVDPELREFMDRFFGQDGRRQRRDRGGRPERRPQGLGSGFIIDAAGIVVTNNHVIENADAITVVLSDGKEYRAKLLGTDPKTDLAVLRINARSDLPTVPWGDSDAIEVGDWAIAIGNPFGFGGTVTAGIISARGRQLNAGPYDDYLQIDAPINKGNSGGPLFDQRGRVIGVNTAIYSPSGGSVGIGFAIPSNQARRIVADLVDDGEVERGWLGVTIRPLDDELAESLGLTSTKGALVAETTQGGPAARGGLRRGDVIVDFAGAVVRTVRDLTRAVADTAPGTRAKVTIMRKGRSQIITVRTGRFPT